MTHRSPAVITSLLAALLLGATACSHADDKAIIDSGPLAPQASPDRASLDAITAATLGPDGVAIDSSQIALLSALQPIDSCDTLLTRIKDEALKRVGPYGFGNNLPVYETDDMAGRGRFNGGPSSGRPSLGNAVPPTAVTPSGVAPGGVAPGAAASDAGGTADAKGASASAPAERAQQSDQTSAGTPTAPASTAAAGPGVSGTNNQEVGVDEADLVKTDGKHMVVLSGSLLRVIDLTGATPTQIGQIPLPDVTGAGGELFLTGDRALLMTSGWTNQPFSGGDGLSTDAVASDWYLGSPTGRLLEIDLTRGEITRTLDFEGAYLSAREVNGTIRVVVSASASRLAFVYPSADGATGKSASAATAAAEAANRSIIEHSTIDQWLPTFQITEHGTATASGPLVDCDRVYLPRDFAGFGSLVLLTVDPAQGLQIVDATSVLTDAQTVYASTDTVAVATPRWPTYGPDGAIVANDEPDFTTALHTFDISNPARATYLASGSVPGHLLSQYSLSEQDGYLRVASTAGSPWSAGAASGQSFVTVLARDGQALRVVGQVGGLGQGEQIYAVRFVGDQGYVVTFRQTDPLYTIDLRDPTHPKVSGQLDLPGFSAYLHPLDAGHLLGVGSGGNSRGATDDVQVSLFDVSDPAHPVRTAKLPLGGPAPKNGPTGRSQTGNSQTGGAPTGGSSTPVASDAKAFTYWQGKAVIPVSWWRAGTGTSPQANGSDAVVVSVDPTGGLHEVGRVGHPAIRPACDSLGYGGTSSGRGSTPVSPAPTGGVVTKPIVPGPTPPCYNVAEVPEIVRSLVVGDNLFTVSRAGVAVNRFDSLRPVTWIPFA